jgi:hypothetical protein
MYDEDGLIGYQDRLLMTMIVLIAVQFDVIKNFIPVMIVVSCSSNIIILLCNRNTIETMIMMAFYLEGKQHRCRKANLYAVVVVDNSRLRCNDGVHDNPSFTFTLNLSWNENIYATVRMYSTPLRQ